MKFSCPKCDTRYNIADAKVPIDRAFRIKCKKCGNPIRIRRKEEEKEEEAPQTKAPNTNVSPEQKTEQKQEALPPPPPHEATRVASIADIKRIRAASKHDDDPPKEVEEESPPEEFHVMIDGQQEGPFTYEQLVSKINERLVDKRCFIWSEIIEDWKPLSKVDTFKDALKGSGDASWRTPKSTPEAKRKKAKKPPPPPPINEDLGSSNDQSPLSEFSDEEDSAPEAIQSAPPVAHQAPPPAAGDTAPMVLTPDMLSNLVEEPAQSPAVQDEALDESGHSLFVNDTQEEYFDNEPPPPKDKDYLDAPPGETTKLFLNTAGIFQRRRAQKIWAISATVITVLFVSIVSLDIFGILTLPGMGLIYDATGMTDPNADRAVERIETKLTSRELTEVERERLEIIRRQLMGIPPKKEGGDKYEKEEKKDFVKVTQKSKPATAPVTQGIKDTRKMKSEQRDLAADIFGDSRKKEKKVNLAAPDRIEAPNLPEGLTADAILEVVTKNNKSMMLCTAEASRKGERLDGRMEIQITIDATGSVQKASIQSRQFSNSAMRKCTLKRIRNWKFPRFNGEPVTVSYPYILQPTF
ncbi:zinc-ribbon domain-containing protein [Myxococcota bacterium]|nr:zinc-ribbon domain-containing protein [Myxococcota bacterium]